MELQDLQQGDAGYHLGSRRVEIFPQRSSLSSGNLNRLQKSQVLYNDQETQLLSSSLVLVPHLLQLHSLPLPQMVYGEA